MIQAAKMHFQAHIEKHRINVETYLHYRVGVAEHPNIMQSIEDELANIAEYHDKLEMLETYFE
ncbi:MAG TPA: hypothetical protein DGP89_09490 [Saprospirales bacterium]|nr:hypothetical protein [Saprospirales bacterium]